VTSEKNPDKVAAAKARAEKLGPARRSDIARKAAVARHNKDAPVATHESSIKLGDLEVECAILADGRRVISERAMTRAFGGRRGGSHWKRMRESGANLPVYLSANNFLPFIDNGLGEALISPIKYRTMNGNIANGLEASLLPKVATSTSKRGTRRTFIRVRWRWLRKPTSSCGVSQKLELSR
jgi:hypothetical protein